MSTPSTYKHQAGDHKSVVPRYVLRLGDAPGRWVLHDRLLVDDEHFDGPTFDLVPWVLRRVRELGTTILEIDDTGSAALVAQTIRAQAPATLQITFRRRSDLLTAHNIACECCHLPWPSVKKYKGIGYWCDICMHEGCFSDDIDAQNPAGSPPYYQRRDANHERMAALFAHVAAQEAANASRPAPTAEELQGIAGVIES